MKDDDLGLGHVKFGKFLVHSRRTVQWACLKFRTEATTRERDLIVTCEQETAETVEVEKK